MTPTTPTTAATFVETRYAHIVLDEAGVPCIAGTRTKVVQIITDYRAWGWDADEIHEQYPQYTRGQIHSAFAYYWDHQAELDADMARREALADQLQREAPPVPFVERLRAQRQGQL